MMQSRDNKRGIPEEVIVWLMPLLIIAALALIVIPPALRIALQRRARPKEPLAECLTVDITRNTTSADGVFLLSVSNSTRNFEDVDRPFFGETRLHILDQQGRESEFSREADGIDLAAGLDPGQAVEWPFSLPGQLKSGAVCTIWVSVNHQRSDRLTVTNDVPAERSP